MNYIPFILLTVLTNAVAQLLLKQGMLSLGPLEFAGENIVLKVFQVVFNPWVFAGLTIFVISMASHLYVLSKVELSFAYPFLSLVYVRSRSSPISSFAKTSMPWRIAGIAFICVGTILIAQSGRTDPREIAGVESTANTKSTS